MSAKPKYAQTIICAMQNTERMQGDFYVVHLMIQMWRFKDFPQPRGHADKRRGSQTGRKEQQDDLALAHKKICVFSENL